MPLSNSGPVSMMDIRNAAIGQSSPNPTNYGTTNSAFFNLNFYRDKYYFVANGSSNGTYAQFPNTSSTISMNNFLGIGFNCNCDCLCDCVCNCDGDGG